MPLREVDWELLNAAKKGDLSAARTAVFKGADHNAKDNYDWTPAHFAAENGHLDVLEWLVDEKGADYNAKNNDGITPVHLLAACGHLEVLKWLVEEKGADINVKNTNGWTPTHFAAQSGLLEVLKWLVNEKGADPNAKGEDFRTPAHFAAEDGRLEVLKWLVDEKGADINAKNTNGWTPARLAVEKGRLEVLKWLVDEKGVDVNAKDSFPYQTLAHCAARNGHLEVLKWLVDEKGADHNAKNIIGWTPAHFAAEDGRLKVLKWLVDEKGADPNVKGNDGQTLALIAAKKRHLEVLKWLVDEKGADPNAKGYDGQTLAHFAAEDGDLEMLKWLVDKKGADFNLANNQGKTVKQLAKKNLGASIISIIFAELIEKASDEEHFKRMDIISSEGEEYQNLVISDKIETRKALITTEKKEFGSLITKMMEEKEMIDQLQRNLLASQEETERTNIALDEHEERSAIQVEAMVGMQIRERAAQLKKSLDATQAALLSAEENIARKDISWDESKEVKDLMHANKEDTLAVAQTMYYAARGEVALHYAVMSNSVDAVNWLITRRSPAIKADVQDEQGYTPLVMATILDRLPIVQLFVREAEGLSKEREGTKKAIHHAAELGYTSLVEFFLQEDRGLLNVQAENGDTPLMCATKNNRIDVIRLFLEQEASVSLRDTVGNMPIHITRDCEVMKLLLEAHSKQEVSIDEMLSGRTALMQAILEGHKDMVDLLTQHGASVALKDPTGCVLIQLARNCEIMELLLKAHEQQSVPINNEQFLGYTLLMRAVKDGDKEAVDLLIKHNANVDAPIEGRLLQEAIALNRNDILASLLEARDITEVINSPNTEHKTALMLAVEQNNLDVVRLLLDKEARLDVVDAEGNTALHLATNPGKIEMLKLLLDKCDHTTVDIENSDSETALIGAIKSHDLGMMRCLLEAGSKVDGDILCDKLPINIAASCRFIEGVNFLIQKGAQLLLRSEQGSGDTVFHVAANIGDVELVKVLLARPLTEHIDNILGKDDRTPFMCAASGQVAQLFIQKGSNPGKVTASNETALHVAAELGHTELLKDLLPKLCKVIDINKPRSDGKTALDCATNGEIQKLLEKAGAVHLQHSPHDFSEHSSVPTTAACEQTPKTKECVQVGLPVDSIDTLDHLTCSSLSPSVSSSSTVVANTSSSGTSLFNSALSSTSSSFSSSSSISTLGDVDHHIGENVT